MKSTIELKTLHGSKMIVGIIGGHLKNTTPEAVQLAELAGQYLAEKGITVASCGEDGIMEAACKGAKSVANSITIAITKGNKKNEVNKYCDYIIPTSLDLAFMNVLAWSADGVLAFDGRFGTTCEIGLLLDIGKPIVLLGKHELINTDKINSPTCLHLPEYSEANIIKAIDFIVKHTCC
jgi:uncharacterized protein (TIGR00725 family)